MEEKRKRGRPRLNLTEEEVELRRIKHNAKTVAWHKKNRQEHPEKYDADCFKVIIRIPLKNKEALKNLVKSQKTTYSDIFTSLIFEKYGIDLKN